ncbi:MAG: hypothetical protein RMJ87_01700 [Cytophagales bacterium]|nr:hypothetical protein [Bernardetiaceae bacterium]MDW8203717.1 hypothetical protein [Cytophagales bacterium]
MRKICLLVALWFWCMFLWGQRLDFIMDMVHNNPGEPPFQTKYNSPVFLQSEGFNATVPHWHINCLITYENFHRNIIPRNSPTARWIAQKAAEVDRQLAEWERAGIDVYPFTDFLVLPLEIWNRYGDAIRRQDTEGVGSVMGDKAEKPLIPDMQSPVTQALVRAQVAGIFNRFPQLDGLVLRFGETYLYDTPYHRGGSPIRKGKAGIQDHITLLNILREEICVKRNKRLFYRTWDFGFNFHNNPEYYSAVTAAIEPHPNLLFSIKYQQDDFLRMTPFNPCIGIGKHRQIVEAQSAMEVYGKGAHPYYSAIGVIDGWPETKYEIVNGQFTGRMNAPDAPRGIKDIVGRGLLAGVMTWSRGGGWQGPYISNEFWIDLNTYVVAHWAQNTTRTEEELFYEFAARRGITGMEADRLRQIALLSVEGVRKGQLNSFTVNDKWWARDEFFSVASNRDVLHAILKGNWQEKVLAEKAEAAAIWRQIESIARQMTLSDTLTLDYIRVSATYGRIKYELIEQMWRLMIADAEARQTGIFQRAAVADALQRYRTLWQEWRELKARNPQCATLYTELAFRNKKEGSIGELVENLQAKIAANN